MKSPARATGVSQPTPDRHICALEATLGVPLFRRAANGIAPTDVGLELLPHARAMREAAARIGLATAGQSESLAGTVCITASRIVSHHHLPAVIARLRREEPGIAIELVPSDTTENLLFREADIAVRMYRPTQLDIVASHVADLATGIYAARSYLDRARRPSDLAQLMALDIVGFDRSDQINRLTGGLGERVRREDFPVRCDDQVVYWNLVRAGCGVGGMQRLVGDADPVVERVADFVPVPDLPVWLAAPETLRQTPRLRRVFDLPREAFRDPRGA